MYHIKAWNGVTFVFWESHNFYRLLLYARANEKIGNFEYWKITFHSAKSSLWNGQVIVMAQSKNAPKSIPF